MKFKWLIPSLAITTTMPLVGMVSCGINEADYKIDLAKIRNYIGMEDIVYLQFNSEETMTQKNPSGEEQLIESNVLNEKCSPDVYNYLHIRIIPGQDPPYNEGYVYKDDASGFYYRKHRNNPGGNYIIDGAEAKDLLTPQKTMKSTLGDYNLFADYGGKLDFNRKNLDYEGTVEFMAGSVKETLTIHAKFYRNQLVDWHFQQIVDGTSTVSIATIEDITIHFTYKHVTPFIPE